MPRRPGRGGLLRSGLLRSGLLVSATCNDCHASHAVFPHQNPRSRLLRLLT